ncbi:MAG: sigma-70 family RNA polymerase sigma factor [Flavobacteriaceae bacterium]|nr:sigma-70 family RNA polymerase sigma factor [Flavobacteriaceae bacterium]
MIWDDKLTKRIIQGDKVAFELCYRQLSPYVYNAIFKICQDKELSNDLLQETFLTAYQKSNELKPDTHLLAWLKRVAFNKTINSIKRLNKFDDVNVEQTIDPSCSITQSVENEQLFLIVLSKVSKMERFILWLYFVEQYKHHEIAELIDKSTSYSKVVVSRTITSIKKLPIINEVSYG